jgi:2'-5' RNA ligase
MANGRARLRLFAALDLSDEASSSLAASVPFDARLRYVPRAQWHVTVAFYDEVADSLVADLAERLSRAAARTPAPRLRLAGAGAFPAVSRPARVLWCGLAGDVETVKRLAERAVAAGRRAGLDLENRRFRPHLTLARARGEPVEMGAAVSALSGYSGPEWIADELRLVRSHLGPKTHHEILASWPLRKSA